jgi:FKBP-type peptidyl-prolyl cis-trans isomerase (trigger factor)
MGELVDEAAHLESQLADNRAAQAMVQAMLRREDERIAKSSVDERAIPLQEIRDVLISSALKQVLRSKGRPVSTEEFKDELANISYNFGDKAPGRVIHFSLVAMQNGGEVKKLPDGRWAFSGASASSNGFPGQEAQAAN